VCGKNTVLTLTITQLTLSIMLKWQNSLIFDELHNTLNNKTISLMLLWRHHHGSLRATLAGCGLKPASTALSHCLAALHIISCAHHKFTGFPKHLSNESNKCYRVTNEAVWVSDLIGSQTTCGECASCDDPSCSWEESLPAYRPYCAANIVLPADCSGRTAGAAVACAGEHAT